MTRWGFVLLAVFVGLGLSRIGEGKAARIGAVLTVMIVGAVVFQTAKA